MLPLYISKDRNPNDPVNPVRTSPRSLLIYAREAASALAQKSPSECLRASSESAWADERVVNICVHPCPIFLVFLCDSSELRRAGVRQ